MNFIKYSVQDFTRNKDVFAVITVTYLIVGNPWIYFAIGYVVAQSELTLNKKI